MTTNPPREDEPLPCPNPWCESHQRPDRNYKPFVRKARPAPEMSVGCPVCPMHGPWRDTEAEAIAAWNTRAHPPAKADDAELVEAMEGAATLLAAIQDKKREYNRPYLTQSETVETILPLIQADRKAVRDAAVREVVAWMQAIEADEQTVAILDGLIRRIASGEHEGAGE